MSRRRQETIKFLTFDELKRLFGMIKAEGNKRDRALFLTAYRHGLRASEVGRLHKTALSMLLAPNMRESQTALTFAQNSAPMFLTFDPA